MRQIEIHFDKKNQMFATSYISSICAVIRRRHFVANSSHYSRILLHSAAPYPQTLKDQTRTFCYIIHTKFYRIKSAHLPHQTRTFRRTVSSNFVASYLVQLQNGTATKWDLVAKRGYSCKTGVKAK